MWIPATLEKLPSYRTHGNHCLPLQSPNLCLPMWKLKTRQGKAKSIYKKRRKVALETSRCLIPSHTYLFLPRCCSKVYRQHLLSIFMCACVHDSYICGPGSCLFHPHVNLCTCSWKQEQHFFFNTSCIADQCKSPKVAKQRRFRLVIYNNTYFCTSSCWECVYRITKTL